MCIPDSKVSKNVIFSIKDAFFEQSNYFLQGKGLMQTYWLIEAQCKTFVSNENKSETVLILILLRHKGMKR